MIIRPMTDQDIPEVLHIGLEVEGFRVSENPEDYFWSEAQLRRWVASEDVLLVAESDDKVVGFVLTAHHRPTGKVTWENQVVLPEYRGQGIAKALIVEMEKRLKDQGATYLHFLTKTDNPHLDYYKKSFEPGHTFVWFGKHL